MENKRVMNKKVIIGGIALAVIIAVFAFVYAIFGAKPTEGSKVITIEVIDKEKESVTYKVSTDAEFLRQAMEEAEGLTFSGQESEYGLTVEMVNGEEAAFLEGAYWAFYVNGEYCMYGIDTQPIQDGDAFKIEYMVYVEE